MIVYHASYTEIRKPDISFSREGLDFGRGFYVTKLQTQAENYAEKFKLRGKEAIINIYEFPDNITESINYKIFDVYDEEWLDFIIANRSGSDCTHYDIVEGGVADDKIFRTIDLYFSGDISKEEALGRLRFEHPNHQICLSSQSVIDNYLNFLRSIKL
ncbi:MAG: DUF3990 domain-containing protein [Duncaniella sp.]|nr:DUF3990 domain-containing protein [Duncaniella sp.]